MTEAFCVDVVKDRPICPARRRSSTAPKRRSQITSKAFTDVLQAPGVAFEDIFIERLWQTVRYEDARLRD